MGSLTPNGQASSVAQSSVAPDVHEHLDVLIHFASQIALDLVLSLDYLAKLDNFGLAEMVGLGASVDTSAATDLEGLRAPDPVDVGERNFDSLLAGQINASDSCHGRFSSALALLVPGVVANHSNDAATSDDPALETHFSNR